MKNLQWHQIIIALLIGILIGGAFVKMTGYGRFGGPKQGIAHKDRMLEKLSRKLDLTAEQKTQVRAIFEAKEPQMKALHDEIGPRFKTLREATDAEIRKILTPEQITKLDELQARRAERMRKFRELNGFDKLPRP